MRTVPVKYSAGPRAEGCDPFFFSSICSSESTQLPLRENVFGDGQRREDVRPADVERKMSEDLTRLLFRQAVVHCPTEVVRHLRHLAIGNQCSDGDEATIARR